MCRQEITPCSAHLLLVDIWGSLFRLPQFVSVVSAATIFIYVLTHFYCPILIHFQSRLGLWCSWLRLLLSYRSRSMLWNRLSFNRFWCRCPLPSGSFPRRLMSSYILLIGYYSALQFTTNISTIRSFRPIRIECAFREIYRIFDT